MPLSRSAGPARPSWPTASPNKAKRVNETNTRRQSVVTERTAGVSEVTDLSLAKRVNGLSWNLNRLKPEEESRILRFSADDWLQMQNFCACNGGEGIAYVELDARLLGPKVLAGLHLLCNLECVTVDTTGFEGPIDFGMLRGKEGNLRINIVGEPKGPLNITVRKSVKVEGRNASSLTMARSLVFNRDEFGNIESEGVDLAMPGAIVQRSNPVMPLVGDNNLLASLETHLKEVAASPGFRNDRLDCKAIAQSIVLCGRFDSEDDFGLDFSWLNPLQMRCVQALPPLAWAKMRSGAERAQHSIEWLDIPGCLETQTLPESLRQLFPFPKMVGRPCANDLELIAALVDQMPALSSSPRFANQPFDSNGVARALALCGRVDSTGKFGFDLKGLTSLQASIVMALPPQAWSALQAAARRAGKDTSWIELHDDTAITTSVSSGLRRLSPVSRLSVKAPAKGNTVDLGDLQGLSLSLKHVEVRPRADEHLIVYVPEKVNVKLDDTGSVRLGATALKRTKIRYVDTEGADAGEVQFAQQQLN